MSSLELQDRSNKMLSVSAQSPQEPKDSQDSQDSQDSLSSGSLFTFNKLKIVPASEEGDLGNLEEGSSGGAGNVLNRSLVSSAIEEIVPIRFDNNQLEDTDIELPNYQKALHVGAACALLWGFLVNLSLVGIGFKLLGGKDSADMFSQVNNPFSAMMAGILATVLVQSSSTSTSIIVAVVGAGMMPADIGIPMIMGANIGTTVTNTLLSLAYFKNTEEYKRGFAGASVHDLFNFLTVSILLPLQWSTKFLSKMTWEMSKGQQPCEGDCKNWEGPVKRIVSPATKFIAVYDKKVAKDISLGQCDLEGDVNICEKRLLKSGALKDWGLSDKKAGAVCLAISIPVLCVCLIILVKLLKKLLRGRARRAFQNAVNYNPYLSMLIGCMMTILVQSSSVTTSVLTPLCAIGAITLEQMFPLTLGANLGTTVTGLLAASVATSNPAEALQVALAHLFFNLLGIMIWYPNKTLRSIPLKGAKKLGEMAQRNRALPFLYVGTAFVALPAACYGISAAVSGK